MGRHKYVYLAAILTTTLWIKEVVTNLICLSLLAAQKHLLNGTTFTSHPKTAHEANELLTKTELQAVQTIDEIHCTCTDEGFVVEN